MVEGVKQIILPDQPPENAYKLLAEIELEIRNAKTTTERIHAHLHFITVAAAWLEEDGHDYKKKTLDELKPNHEDIKEKFYRLYNTPLIKPLELYYIPVIEDQWREEYLDNLYYEKLRITRILRKHYKWKFGTETRETRWK